MMPQFPISIIIPTFNNPQYLKPCLESIFTHFMTPGLAEVIVVNNGDPESCSYLSGHDSFKIVNAGKNLGWEGGLKAGLGISKSPYVVFLNDDTVIPFSSRNWLNSMVDCFNDPRIAAVGPTSNCVAGAQNIFWSNNAEKFEVPYLIGFCMMVRRQYLDEVGGVDDTLPHHGDDIDLSIRFRKAGYKLFIDRNVFVYHHGFKTGARENPGYWNSTPMIEKTNHNLIRKHGLRAFYDTYIGVSPAPIYSQYAGMPDSEGHFIRQWIKGDNILELGCGAQKTVEPSIGMDFVPQGTFIPGLDGKYSVADVVGDISKPLPFEEGKFDTIIARHVLEHIPNFAEVLIQWSKPLKDKGRLILAVPDHEKSNTIPMNFQHCVGFTQKNLKLLMELIGWETKAILDSKNGVSFIGVFEKNGIKNI